jgi:hypothetical protein
MASSWKWWWWWWVLAGELRGRSASKERGGRGGGEAGKDAKRKK